MTQAEELDLQLELIFDNSPIDILGSGRIQKKNLIFRLESGALLGQPIEQPMTTNTSKQSHRVQCTMCGYNKFKALRMHPFWMFQRTRVSRY